MAVQLGSVTVVCPECKNDRVFNGVNFTGSGGRCNCGSCGVSLVIANGEITVRR